MNLKTIAAAVALAVSFAHGAETNAALSADFSREVGPIRRALHSSGFGPLICSCPQQAIDDVKSMGFLSARTHDWALINANQRVCDYFHVFPLMHLDAKDPKNYVFGPTDYLLKRTREETGLDVFYRLGTSIEHSGDKIHFNSLIPDDFEKVAEVFAATVRHYNRGWANGFEWGIKYWEIWNEPDGLNNMWCLPDGDGAGSAKTPEQAAKNAKRRALFAKFFALCVKRIKGEFPDVKVGGPALCSLKEDWVRAMFDECKRAGVKPDFLSWHHYVENPNDALSAIARARKLCDEYGFTDCELVINEWHYFAYSRYDWAGLRSPDPKIAARAWEGPASHNGIDSSCFNLTLLSRFQSSKLDQAFYYGCRHAGSWGYMDEHKRKFKVYYGLKAFGDFVKSFPKMCASSNAGTVTTLAAKSADGKRLGLLVADYRGRGREICVDVAGVMPNAKATAVAHDYSHDLAPADFSFADGKLVLRKPDANSAAFFVAFAAE